MTNLIDLTDFFITKSQADDFKLRLTNILDKMFATNFNLEKALIEEFGIEKKDKFVMQLHENKITTNINDFLKSLPGIVDSLPIVTIGVAFEPNQETLKVISQWFLITMNRQFILDFQINKTLVAGATINFDGKFKDYSVRSIFDNICKQTLSPQTEKQNSNNLTEPALHQDTQNITIGR